MSSSEARLLKANPYFVVQNVFESAEYYRDVLGFEFHQFWGEPPSFVMVLRDQIQIMLAQPTKSGPERAHWPNGLAIAGAFDAYIYVDGVDRLYEELKTRGATVLGRPTDQPHDCREFDVEDLNGYVLRFGEDLLTQVGSELS